MRGGASDRDVTIGAVAGTGTDFGLIIDGTVVGSGVYAGKDATGLQIGGLGGAVDISGGVKVGGSVNAISKDASATAIRIGAGATVPEIRVSGKVEAKTGGENAADVATPILVASGNDFPTFPNTGTNKPDKTGREEGKGKG